VRDGFDKASTNRIAAEAGVSIGSLYQYFPSKEALVAAVIDRHHQELMQVVRAVLHRPEILSDEGIGTLIDETTRLVVRFLQ
jgi:AcrR family transcriptional regulator